MTIEYRPQENGGAAVVTVACPFCEGSLDDQQSLAHHLKYHCEESHA